MTEFIIRYRWIILTVSVVLCCGFGALIPLADTDPEIRNYIPAGMPSRVNTDSIEKVFGDQDMIIATFTDTSLLTSENMRSVREVDRAFSQLPGIGTINSLFSARKISGSEGTMIVDPLVKKIPETDREREALKNDILANRFAVDVVASKDMTTAAITGTINRSVPEHITLGRVDSILKNQCSGSNILIGGLPYIRRYILQDVNKDAITLIPLALIIMLIVLKVTLGEWKSVFMPFTVVVLSTAFAMGLIPLFGWKISILILLVPVIMISVANNYGIYLVARYQELAASGMPQSKHEMLRSVTGNLNMPILFSGLTTIAGILGLLTHSIIPAREVGVLSAIGVTLALTMSLLFIPVLIWLRKPPSRKKQIRKKSADILDRALNLLSIYVIRHPSRVLIGSAIILILVSGGIFLLRIDTNQENYFPSSHPVRKASQVINSKFGGSQTISVMVSGDIKDPAVMQWIDRLSSDIKLHDGVGNVFSISDVVREMSKALYDPAEEGYDKIPSSYEAIAQMFELYNMSGSPDDFSQLMNFENTDAHILIRLSRPENDVINSLRVFIADRAGDVNAHVVVGGYAIIMADFARKIIAGQVSSLVFALFTVFLLLAIIFRSVKGGLAGSIPLAASILIQFGIMGFANIALDAATALLSSIMIGVGVDFTIQYLWRYNCELRKGVSHSQAIDVTYKTTGRSIVINGLSVMAGFSATFISGFLSIRYFGYLVLLSIGSCLLCAVIVMPAFMLWFKPSFIEADLSRRKNKKERNENTDIFTGHVVASDGDIRAAARSCPVDAEES
ncbi:MAG TPA: MMPL family transporter [Bacteroidales bacterium]|nr:MMPL family transporter [Bacteroidales bacterium]